MKRVLVYGMTDNPGGIESYLMLLLEKLKEYDILLDFVTDFPTIAYREDIKKAGARVYYIPPKSKNLPGHMGAMRRILKKHPEYDSVYFNLLDAGGVVTALVPWLMGRKIIVHSHNGDTDKIKLHKRCKKMLSRITKGYVACSGTAARYMFTEKVQDKVLIIPNAIDVDRYMYQPGLREEKRRELGIQDKFVVCHVGRITRQKNPYRVLDIFEELNKREPDSILLYVGNGDMGEEIKAYISKKELPVVLLGVRNDIPELMNAADVFLLPSLYEGFPIVAVEAQCQGLPTVMSTNITKEIKLTPLASFISLEEADSVWADRLLSYRNTKRTGQEELIREKGYDKKCMNRAFEKLAKML